MILRRALHILTYLSLLGLQGCNSETREVRNVISTNDSSRVDFIGDHFIDAFEQHIVQNYDGSDIYSIVETKPFLLFKDGTVFKFDIDTVIQFYDTLSVIRFHGALDPHVNYGCHVCSAPQVLGVFVKRDLGYFLKEIIEASELLECPWGGSTALEIHFEDSGWPGPMLFSTYTDGQHGNFDTYVKAIDISPGSLGRLRFLFSNTIRRESTYFPDSKDLELANFPFSQFRDPWIESYKIMERDLHFEFDEVNEVFEILRTTHHFWDIWFGPDEENSIKIPIALEVDTLSYSIEGGIYSPK
jgi:hypothetical protein